MTEKDALHIIRHASDWGYATPKLTIRDGAWGLTRDDGICLFHIEDACNYMGFPLPAEMLADETWAVLLSWYDKRDHKIAAIKCVREMAGLDLMDAKNLIESAPAVVVRGITKKLADALVCAYSGDTITFIAMPEPNTFNKNPG